MASGNQRATFRCVLYSGLLFSSRPSAELSQLENKKNKLCLCMTVQAAATQ